MTTTVDIINNAIALIERGWTQRAAARTATGTPCGPRDPDAAMWCVNSAIYSCGTQTQGFEVEKLVRKIIGYDRDDPTKKPQPESTVAWNDTPKRTQLEVLHVLHTARSLILASTRSIS